MSKISIIKVTSHDDIGTLRVLIPKEIREKLDIKKGDSLFVTFDKKGHLIYKKIEDSFKP